MPGEQIAIGLNALESWVIRRTLLRYTMKDVNKLMVAILKTLDGVPAATAGEAVRDFLAQQNADARRWPRNEVMSAELPRLRLYGNIRQGRLRVVFEAVEMKLRSEKHEAVALPSKLEIEHVMPRGWRTHWDPEPKLSPDAAAERDHRVNTIGNLTLLTRRLNGTLSNRPWTDTDAEPLGGTGVDAGKGKRSLIDKYSLLVLSKEITHGHPDAWTDYDVDARSRFLAEQICEVWPGPPSLDPAGVESGSADSGLTTAAEVALVTGPGDESPQGTSAGSSDDPRGSADVVRRFEDAMLEVYVRAKKEAGYKASYYLEMLHSYGGLATAHRLLASATVSDGFAALWERQRLDLTVENVVLRTEFESLFEDEDREVARSRLREYGFHVE